MQRNLRSLGQILTPLAIVGAACRDTRITTPNVIASSHIAAVAAGLPTNWRNFPVTDPKATPWISMSSAGIANAIGMVRGRAMIGFKDPDSVSGVDRTGRGIARAASVAAGKAKIKALGLSTLYEFKMLPAVVVQFAATPALVDSLRANPYVDYIEPDGTLRLLSQVTPWNIARIQGPQAWPYSTGAGVKLLILDTGVGPHEDLNVAVAYNCLGGTTADQVGHGTAVAGIAAAVNNGIDVVGGAPGVSLWSGTVWDPTVHNVTASQVACAIDVGRVNKVSVINMSFRLDSAWTTVTSEIQGGYNNDDIVFVAAAGNNGAYGGTVDYPASLAQVVAVSAIMYNNTLAPYSSYGSKIELAAPADSAVALSGVLTTALVGAAECPATVGNLGFCSGTSSASPHVAAAAALLRAYHPTWNNAAVRNQLDCTAQYIGSSTYFGNGLVRAKTALTVSC